METDLEDEREAIKTCTTQDGLSKKRARFGHDKQSRGRYRSPHLLAIPGSQAIQQETRAFLETCGSHSPNNRDSTDLHILWGCAIRHFLEPNYLLDPLICYKLSTTPNIKGVVR